MIHESILTITQQDIEEYNNTGQDVTDIIPRWFDTKCN